MSARSSLDEPTQVQGFGILLDKGLRATGNDQLIVIHDESMSPYWSALITAITSRDLAAAFINVPKQHQHYICARMLAQPNLLWLPLPLVTAINTSTVILNLLDGDLATSPVRRAILAQPRSGNSRLAHIPGISDEILLITGQTEFDDVYSAGELTAWTLGNGQCADLVSYDADGAEHRLTIELGGWDNEPLMSPGTILPGSWGNFPPGETFCCPEPLSVNGSICINGSVPNYVLQPQDEVVLEFESGFLTSWRGTSENSPALTFFNEQKLVAKDRGDKNWNVFCELGIGLNAAIKELSGNSLFDEKVAGTVHIAIGDNTAFGHNVQASIHADLVVRNPSLVIDGAIVIDHGVLCIGAIRQRRDGWEPPAASLRENTSLRLKEAEVREDGGLLKRRLCKGSRVGLVQMANGSRSAALSKLHQILVQGEPTTAGQLIRQYPDVEGFSTGELLAILQHYRCFANDPNAEDAA